MIIFNRYGVRFCEAWFDELPITGADIIIRRQQKKPLENSEASSFATILIDLSKTEKALLEDVKKNTRYEIRRAENSDKCQVRHITSPSHDLIAEFERFYRGFAKQKKLSTLNSIYLKKLCESDNLILSHATFQDEVLVWHAYYCASGRARLLYSASLFRELNSTKRNLIGRANRLLHWKDILKFKDLNFQIYDLGGWTPPESLDFEREKINNFKEEFGGLKVFEFNCIESNSMLGAVARKLIAFLKYLRLR